MLESALPLTAEVPTLGTLLAAAWLIGAAAVLVYALWKNISFRRSAMRHAVPVEADCPLPVYLCENISSPCLCGVLRPVVLLNDAALENERYFDLALRHELTHFRRRDIWLKTLALWVNALHWFNPLAWYMVRLVERDTELACDEAALNALSPEEHAAYGQTILSAVSRLKKEKP